MTTPERCRAPRRALRLACVTVTAGGLTALALYRGLVPDEQTTLPGRPGTTAEGAPV